MVRLFLSVGGTFRTTTVLEPTLMRQQHRLPMPGQHFRGIPVSDAAPAPRTSSDLARGEIPEIAALGNELTTLFNTLGISQSAYAVRVSLDKSVVSRCLRGRRLATRDFIDRLIREVETQRHTSLQTEVRSNLYRLHLTALRVCDPALYELESVRAEMEQTQHRVEMLSRHQEALHDLLEKKESQIRHLHAELDQMRQDRNTAQGHNMEGEAPRDHPSPHQDELAEEVARLKAELADVTAARADAEHQCSELESQIREMEEQLALRSGGGGSVTLPIVAFQNQLMAYWETDQNTEAARELTEAALIRPVDDLSDLVAWLDNREDQLHADHIVREVARLRNVDDVAEFGKRTLHRQWTPSSTQQAARRAGLLVEETCAVMTPHDIARLHTLWPDRWDQGATNRSLIPSARTKSVLDALLESPRSLNDLAQVLARIPADDERAVTNLHDSASGYRTEYQLTLLLLAFQLNWHHLFTLLASDLTKNATSRYMRYEFKNSRLRNMADSQWKTLTHALLDGLTLDHFVPIFTTICISYEEFISPPGMERTPIPLILQKVHDIGLLSDFSGLMGRRLNSLRPGRRKERDLARRALNIWAKSQA